MVWFYLKTVIMLPTLLILLVHVLALAAEIRMPTFCVDPKVLEIFSKRLSCYRDSNNQTVFSNPRDIRDWITYHSDEVRLAAGSPMFTRLHELYAYYWFAIADNPYRVERCEGADLEFIPFLPVHYVAVRSQPSSTCSYQRLIDDILAFVDLDHLRKPNYKAKERFLVASTFNMRTEMQRGLPNQQRRGMVYDKVTSFVTGTYIGHYERFPQCPDTLRKGWKGIVEIPYMHLKAPAVEQWQTAPRSLNSVLFAGRMFLFGPERVCSVRSAIASLAVPIVSNRERQFTFTVINMTTFSSTTTSLQQRQKRLRAEDMTTRLYSRHSFCIVAKGDSYSTASLYMAIMSNCVPIVVGDWFVFAFNWIVPYDKFVVRIAEEDFLRNPEEALNYVVNNYGVKSTLLKMRKEMMKWKKLLRFGIEPWESAAALQMRSSLREKFPSFTGLPRKEIKAQVTVPPLELFIFEVQFRGLEMTERPSHKTEASSSVHHFTGNESLSCVTPFHCPPFANIVTPYRFPGFSKGLEDTRSELCRRSHGLIGMYKMVYFMGCVRILWPLRPGFFKPDVERRLSNEEKAFVINFHKVGFSPEVYPPVPSNASIIPFEKLV